MSSEPKAVLRLLERAHRLNRMAEASRGVFHALGLCVLAGLALVVFDALYGLNGPGLVVLDLVWLVALAAAGWLVIGRWAANRYRPERMAVEIQRRMGISHGRLINTLQLAQQEEEGISEGLREYAVRLGDELAGTLHAEAAVDRTRLKKNRRFALASVVAGLLFYACWPRLFHTVLPRLADPFGDHPPFTLLRFEVGIDPQPLYYGQAADLAVHIRGPRLPARAEAVFVEKDGLRNRVPLWAEPVPETDRSSRAGFSLFRKKSARYSLHLERAEESRSFYIDTARGRSGTFLLEVLPVPLFEGIEVEYVYPEYTKWPVKRTRLKDGTIKALQGTLVRMSVDSNIALDEGRLSVEPESDEGSFDVVLQPRPDHPATADGAWTLAVSGAYRLGLTGEDGTPGLEEREGLIYAEEDRPPDVQIEHPTPVIVAPENWVVESIVSVRDDVSVDEAVFHARVNEEPYDDQPVEADPHRKDPRRLRQVQQIDLASLGAKPGDTVQYFAAARDNAPEQGQVGESGVGAIMVMSMEEYKDLARSQYGAREMMAELADYLAALDELRARRDAALEELDKLRKELAAEDAQPNAGQVQRLAALRQQLDQYAAAAEELADHMRERAEQEDLYDFEQPYKDWLKQTAEQLAGQQQDARSLLDAWHPDPGRTPWTPGMDAAMASFRENDDPFRARRQQEGLELEQDLRKMELAGDMLLQMARLRRVIEEQRDLTDRMKVLPTLSDDEEETARRLESYGEQQDLLREELSDLRQQLKEAAEAAGDELPKMTGSAHALCERIESLEIENDQFGSARLARRGEAAPALAFAESAAEKLDSLYSDCQGGEGQACQDLDGCLSLSREQTMQALKQMIQGGLSPGMGSVGQSGAGFGGSMATFGMVGPQFPVRGDSMMMQAMQGKQGKHGRALTTDPEVGEGPETIQPEFIVKRDRYVGALPGVPIRYRALAEAYFKRLAEDSTGE